MRLAHHFHRHLEILVDLENCHKRFSSLHVVEHNAKDRMELESVLGIMLYMWWARSYLNK